MGLKPREEHSLHKAIGCAECGNSGYKGRMGIHEMLVNKDNVKLLIARKAKIAEIFEACEANGMITLFDDGIEKAYQGFTSAQEVRRVCIQKADDDE